MYVTEILGGVVMLRILTIVPSSAS